MKNIFKRTGGILLAVALMLQLFTFTLSSSKVYAAATTEGSFISDPLSGNVLDHQLYYFLKRCFLDSDMDKVTTDEVNEWRWFWGSGDVGYRGAMYANNNVKCSEGQWIQEAFSRFGLTDPLDTFCSLSFTYNRTTGGLGKTVNGGDTVGACVNGAGEDFDGSGSTSAQAQALDNLLLEKNPSKYSKARGSLTSSEEYIRQYRTLMRGCGITLTKPYETGAAADNNKLYRVKIVNENGSTEEWLGVATDITGEDGRLRTLVETMSGPPKSVTCGELAQQTVALADDYARHLRDNNDPGSTEGGGTKGPIAGEQTCESEQGVLAWIGCGILGMMDRALIGLDNIINDLLFIDADKFTDDGVKGAWSVMRNLALIILIPMMLLMVIGTALEFGPFDAYTVKKALPRMLIAVIFIVLSLPITEFGVRMSNVFGNGIANMVYSAMPEGSKIDSISDVVGGTNSNSDDARETEAGVLFVGLAAGVAGYAAATMSIGILLSLAFVVGLGLLIGALVLIIRQVLIIFLMILAPLAILAWIFPGNDKLWAIWKTTFIALLLMYPLIVLLIVAGRFFAGIV